MKTPLLLLLIFFAIVLLLYLFFRTEKGWYWKIKNPSNQLKILVEDILKEIYGNAIRNEVSNKQTLVESLKISKKSIDKALQNMQEHNLIIFDTGRIVLQPQGREYALGVIRTHRLYEQYLAEKTGYDKLEWHKKAEQMEHRLTKGEISEIITAIGNPRYDPHGDPIPTEMGNIQDLKGKKLTEVNQGDFAKIIHIEDEPTIIYKQILAENIHIGSILQVIERNEKHIVFYSEGEDFVLIPEIAENITVQPLSKEVEIEDANAIRLSSLSEGETGKIVSISRECRGANRRRLLDLGFVKGSKVFVKMDSPLGNPKAYSVRNTLIALRDDQARHILVEKTENK